MNPESRKELSEKVLIHLYNSAVTGSLRSTALALGMKDSSRAKNPRFKDLQMLFQKVGEDRRPFYAGVAAIAEFAVYCVLDFLETYNRFDSEHNKEEVPRVSLVYTSAAPESVQSVTLSQYGSGDLAKLFKHVARSDEMRSLVESVIDQLARKKENGHGSEKGTE